MSTEIRLWKVLDGSQLRPVNTTRLDLEERLESWLEKDPTLFSEKLLVIGRQVPTEFGGVIDLLCLDQNGDTVIVELKRDRTPREITAQVLDYVTWVKELSHENIAAIAGQYLERRVQLSFEDAFQAKFGVELPELLNESHRMLIVATQIDGASERIIQYLSNSYGVNINAVTFQYFRDEDGDEFLGRAFLIQPSQVQYKTQTKGGSKRRPALSLEEAEDLAEDNGVGDLYKRIVSELEQTFKKRTTITQLSFDGDFDGSSKAVLNIIPGDSSAEQGLRFQIYAHRIADYFKTDELTIRGILPEDVEDWAYIPSDSEEWQGYAGFFQDRAVVERFISGVRKLEASVSKHREERDGGGT